MPLHLVQAEKEALVRCRHFNIIRLHAGFQDESYLYMLLDYAEKGDLFGILQKWKGFNEGTVRFIAAEIALGLEYLHSVAYVIHRYFFFSTSL